MTTKLMTSKLPVEALRLARLIAATTGERQYQTIARLIETEAERMGLAGYARGAPGRSEKPEGGKGRPHGG